MIDGKVARAPAKRVAGRRYGTKAKVVRKGRKLASVALVKKMIHKNMENKLAGTQYQVQFNNTINTAGDAYGLLPTIPLGTNDNARIGNRINPRGLLVTGQVFITPDAGLPPGTLLFPRILILKAKAQNGYQPGLSVDFSRLLDWGQGEHSFTGTLADYRCPVNTDEFVVIKDIKTRLSLGSVEQNSMVCSVPFKVWVPCPKTLTYVDGQSYPQNFAPFICLGFAEGQGIVTPPESTFVTMDWTTTLYYEDA